MHMVPPRRVRRTGSRRPRPDLTDAAGYVEVDKHTLQTARPRTPRPLRRSQTSPVLVANLLDTVAGRPPSYNGYASCPLTLSRHTLLLAEFA